MNDIETCLFGENGSLPSLFVAPQPPSHDKNKGSFKVESFNLTKDSNTPDSEKYATFLLSPLEQSFISPPTSPCTTKQYSPSKLCFSPSCHPHHTPPPIYKISKLQSPPKSSSSHVIDIQNLRRLASQGIHENTPYRAITWRVLLGYLPTDTCLWGDVLRRDRELYRDLVNELFVPNNNDMFQRQTDVKLNAFAVDGQVFTVGNQEGKKLIGRGMKMDGKTIIDKGCVKLNTQKNTNTVKTNSISIKGDYVVKVKAEEAKGNGNEGVEISTSIKTPPPKKITSISLSSLERKRCDNIIINLTHINNKVVNTTTTSSLDSKKIMYIDENNENAVKLSTTKNHKNNIFIRLDLESTPTIITPVKISSYPTPVSILTQQHTDSYSNPYLSVSKEEIEKRNEYNCPITSSSLLLKTYQSTAGILSDTPTSYNRNNNDYLYQGDLQCARVGLRRYLNTLRVVDNNNEIRIDGYAATTPLIISENTALLEEIRKDVVRTHPDLQFFLEDKDNLGQRRYAAIERILFVWAKLNKGVRYVQGMNEIVGTMYFVLANDSNDEWACEAEADTYFLFNMLMGEMRDIFVPDLDDSDTGIKGRMDNMIALLSLHDPEIRSHLDDCGIDPAFYSIRWLTTLLSREFFLPDTVRLWDSMFASTHKDNFMRYVCVTMVMLIRNDLLKGDFGHCLRMLQSYPPTNIEQLLQSSRALWIYESQVTSACHKSGTTLAHALLSISRPKTVIMAYGLTGCDLTRDTNSSNNSSSSTIFTKKAINGTKTAHARSQNVGREMSNIITTRITKNKKSTAIMSSNDGKDRYFYTKSFLEQAGGIFGLATTSYSGISSVEKNSRRATLRRAKSQFYSRY